MAHLDAQAIARESSESDRGHEGIAAIQGRGLPQLRFLVCGRTGIGKSSLINFILGDDVCEIGDPGSLNYDGNLKPQTKTVEGHPIDMNGVQVIIYDSPGLQDGTDNDEEYLHEMFMKCRDVDLVFYCHDMPSTRWTDHEINAIRLLTEKFGANFWDKAVFVLTKANMFQPADPMPEEEEKLHFNRWKDSVVKRFREEVAKQLETRVCGTTLVEEMGAEASEIRHRVDSIPAVPTGSRARQVLLNDKHFIGDLWVNCLERIQDPHLSETFMQATNVKERLVTYNEIEREGRSFGVNLEAFKEAANTMAEPVHKLIHKLTSSTDLPTQPPTCTLPSSLPTETVTAETKYPIIVDEETKERIKRNIKRKWMLGGAALGGLAGSVVLPVVGTAIGAAVGAGIARWLWGRLSDL